MKFTMEVEGKSLQDLDWSTAKCPVCQERIYRIDTEMDHQYFNQVYVGRHWDVHPIQAMPKPHHYITFSPCECRIKVPPNEFEVKVVPRQDPGMRAFAGLIAEAELLDATCQRKDK